MIFWHDKDGRIVLSSTDDTAVSARDEDPEITRMVGPWVDDISAHYVEDCKVVAKPAQPSRHHEFDYPSKSWLLNADAAWKAVRRRRDALLSACDWVVTRVQEEGAEMPEEWRAYRQALRDITEQEDPCAIVWPEVPN